MEKNKIKQRVVGGVVLLALAVIFIPMVLDFRKDYDQVINGTNIPPKPKDFRVETFALSPTSQVKVPRLAAEGSVDSQVQQHKLVQQKRAAEAGTSKAVTKSPPPVKKTTPPKQPVAQKSLQSGWAVQVGSFGVEKNALRLRDKIRRQGFTAFVDRVSVNGKVSHRVRVGPEVDKSKASVLQKRLQQQMGLKGLVTLLRQ